MSIAIVAALAMVLQDITGCAMQMFEASALNLPRRTKFSDYVLGGWQSWRGAVFDQLQWTVAITTTTISVTAFSGHSTSTKVAVALLVSVANLIGSRTGQEFGLWMIRRDPSRAAEVDAERSLEDRIAHLEQRLRVVGSGGADDR